MKLVNSSTEMALLTSILASCSFVTENIERAALFFVTGICVGLLLTLLALVFRMSCQSHCGSPTKKSHDIGSDCRDKNCDFDHRSALSDPRHHTFERNLNMNIFTSADKLERARRLDEREHMIWGNWMDGQADIPRTSNLNCYF